MLDNPTALPLPALTGVGQKRLRPVAYLKAAVALLLALSLTFIVVSNYVGWTARVAITKVKHHCDKGGCYQKVVVEGRDKAFRVADEARVAIGDQAEIITTCNPRCQLDMVAVWPRGTDRRVVLPGSDVRE